MRLTAISGRAFAALAFALMALHFSGEHYLTRPAAFRRFSVNHPGQNGSVGRSPVAAPAAAQGGAYSDRTTFRVAACIRSGAGGVVLTVHSDIGQPTLQDSLERPGVLRRGHQMRIADARQAARRYRRLRVVTAP